MIPATYNIEIYRGDTYYGPLITLPALTEFGGPADLTDATVTAQIRASRSAEAAISFDVTYVNRTTRQVRLTLDAADTLDLPRESVWDLQVVEGTWLGTPLAGSVTRAGQVTQP